MAEQDPHEIVAEIMKDTHIAILTYVDAQGRLVSTPMGTQDLDDPGRVHFITEADTDKMHAIAANPQVNVAYSSDKGWVSLAGTGARNDDRALLERLWDSSASAWMEGGPEDPNSTLLTVTADTASYWESPGKVAVAVQLIKGKVQGTDADPEPQDGQSGTISL
ncbi:pyridoxamine 5'-phosphate oxidase family protein [Janibacter melonis]|uniref:pyridoxamine 5'-phosphate oxidase family protein n=1 Tax=Janibacter melonis TaxID=262209 RepID=UPI002043DA82|nr:pyridoxamine 5'-phosphate oxidase family protein [Janibacter melonis]MCM3555568.1 pyridoxamine 5'-phosphate oxidase family protein [Janibacter melonis]